MANDGISVPYNENLKPLEDLLAGVKRPGNFFVEGAIETPMPRVEVERVGVLSFPIPPTLVAALIQHAARAPYGRGAVDTATMQFHDTECSILRWAR